jgi:putative ABC transport system permease protein
LLLGAGAALVISHVIMRATGIVLTAQIGWDELWLMGGMILFGLVVATVPAFIAYRRPVIEGLTSA